MRQLIPYADNQDSGLQTCGGLEQFSISYFFNLSSSDSLYFSQKCYHYVLPFFYLCDNDPDLTFFPIIINLQFQYNVNVNIIFLSQRHKINQGAQE